METQKHLPTKFVDLYAGDMLYNPDFQWHTIVNYGGLSFGCPIREFNISLTVRNNPVFALIAFVNKALDAVGLDIGGYPPTRFLED